jgi:hypothetical protein
MDQYEHLAKTIAMVNQSLFQNNMKSVKLSEEDKSTPMTDMKLKTFRVSYSGSDIVQAEDEIDAGDIVKDMIDKSDLDYDVEEVTADKPMAVKVENGCTIVNKNANRYLVHAIDETHYIIPVTAMDEADATDQAHNIKDLSQYLVYKEYDLKIVDIEQIYGGVK